LKILIADDNKIERLILSRILENFEHEVIQAEDGNQAIQLYEEHCPQLVFLDVLMPELDGYQAAQTIKRNTTHDWVPIIFLTSLTGAEDLAKCIDVGGDDFVSKPINKVIIKAKLEAFGRILNLYTTVNRQQQKIETYNLHLLQEQEAGKVIFDNIVHKGCLEESNINYHLSPMSIFNGDLMLSTHLNDGSMRFMLADFTGHGLPAAIGSLPSSEIFYGMSNKGFSIPDMMTEMNKKLNEVLPIGVFCCVIIFDIDPLAQRITIWNAGSPDCFLLDTENNSLTAIKSTHLAVGILSPKSFSIKCQSFHFAKHHKIIAATDGIMEAEDPTQAMFGEQRIIDYLHSNINSDNICDGLIAKVEEFCGSSSQSDDLSLVEVSFPAQKTSNEQSEQAGEASRTGISDSTLSLKLCRSSLASFDPIPFFLQTLLSCNELNSHRARIFTLLSELYNNALDHGVLGLDSKIKNDTGGFSKYYELRAKRLNNIEDGFVTISVVHQPTDEGGRLIFKVEDTGEGFDVKNISQKDNKDYSGRGLPLIFNLCDSVSYNDKGTEVEAIYLWNNNELLE